ncbi:MAG TPA: WD40 repeat domain-containing protein, partial [Gemmataceae bacterium]|nr:WD40 repeat domain-containing protein [Gemmataceae bacterium]
PNGATLVSGGMDCAVRQWDVASGKEIRPFAGAAGQVRVLAVSPDGKTVASAGVDRRVHLWDAASGEERRSLEIAEGDITTLLGFSPDGRSLTAVGRGGGNHVRVWDAADGAARSAFSLSEKDYHEAFALSPDASAVAAFGDPDGFAVFDAVKGEIKSKEDTERRGLQAGTFLNGKTLAVLRRADSLAARFGALLLWDSAAGSGDMIALKSDLGAVFWAAASPDGKVVAAAGSGGLIRLWSVATGEAIAWLDAESDFVLAEAFSADGRMLATSGLDGTVSVWEIASASRRCRLKGGQGYIDALAFSPDGRRLYTGGHDGTVLAWDLTDQRATGFGPLDPAKLDDQALEALWDQLAAGDASLAYRAMWTLAAAPKRSAPFLLAHLHRPAPTAAAMVRWIADLDSDDFQTRERASAQLRWFDEATEAALTTALAGRPSPEARRRIEELLEWIHKARVGVHPPDARVVRAIEALEHAGTAGARKALADLADGPEMSLTREAKAALERLRRR